jgi:hypothetical protein
VTHASHAVDNRLPLLVRAGIHLVDLPTDPRFKRTGGERATVRGDVRDAAVRRPR